MTDISPLLKDIEARFHDTRTTLAEIQIAMHGPDGLRLSGRVLDVGTLDEIVEMAKTRMPGAVIEWGDVKILRNAPQRMNVAVNLTGVYSQPSWLAEMVTQNTYGAALEILEQR